MVFSLIGYRGTGKSTIGKRLAEKLNLPFCDSDTIIEQQAERTIAQIFTDEGESGFRDLESSVVVQLMNSRKGIIAWGGGVILSEVNRAEIQKSKKTIWLTATAQTLFSRIYGDKNSASTRPALTDLDPLEEIQFNLNKRETLYRQCADVEFNTENQSLDTIVDQLAQQLSEPDIS